MMKNWIMFESMYLEFWNMGCL